MTSITGAPITSAVTLISSKWKVDSPSFVMGKGEFLPDESPAQANIRYLFGLGIIDKKGKLTSKYAQVSPPTPNQEFQAEVSTLLKSKITIGPKKTTPTVETVLENLLRTSNSVATLEIVGGFLRKLILTQPDFIQSVLKLLHPVDPSKIKVCPPTSNPPDCDIRCTFSKIDRDKAYQLSKWLEEYVKSTIGKSFDPSSIKNDFYYNAANSYGITTFKGTEGMDFELLTIQTILRRSLFVHDGVRYEFDLGENITGKLVSDFGLQPIIDLLTKIIHIENPQEVNHFGWPLLISFYTRGHTSTDKNAEAILLTKSCSQNPLHKQLEKCIKNHHANDIEAECALMFNASVALGDEKVIINTLWDKYSPTEFTQKEDLLWAIKKLIKKDAIPFDLLLSCIQIFSLLHLAVPNQKVYFVRHLDETWVQIKVQDYYLLIPFTIQEALKRIQNESTDEIFNLLYKVWTPPTRTSEPSQLQKYNEHLKLNTILFENELKTSILSLPIQTLLQTLKPDNHFLVSVCGMLPDYMESNINHPIQSYLLSLLEQTFPQYAAIFSMAKNTSILEFRAKWVIALAETQDLSLCRVAYQMFLVNEKLYSEHSKILLINKLLPQDPLSAVQVFNKLKCYDASLFIRIGNALKMTPSGKAYLETSCRTTTQELKRKNFDQGCQVVTNPNSPYHDDLQLNTEFLREALSKDVETLQSQTSLLLDNLLAITFSNNDFPDTVEVKSNTCSLIISTLSKYKKSNFSPPPTLQNRLNLCAENICSFYKELNQYKQLYEFVMLLEDFQTPLTNKSAIGKDLIWALSLMQEQNGDIGKIKRGLFFLKNTPDLPQNELQKIIITYRTQMNGTSLEAALFFLRDVPEIYGEGFSEAFTNPAASICKNLTKKESSLHEAIQILKAYKIQRGELWTNVLLKLSKSDDITLPRLALPLLFEHGRCCSSECWLTVLKTISSHKSKFVYALVDQLRSPKSEENQLLNEVFPSPENKVKALEVILNDLIDRISKSESSTNVAVKAGAIRNIICTLASTGPDLELDLKMVEAILKTGKFDIITMRLICSKFNDLRSSPWLERLLLAMTETFRLLKSDYAGYKTMCESYQTEEYMFDTSVDTFSAAFFFHDLTSFLCNVQVLAQIPTIMMHPLMPGLLTEAMPLLIDYGSYNDSCFSYKLLTSEEISGKFNKKDLSLFWQNYISTRLSIPFLKKQPILPRQELNFFVSHADKLVTNSEGELECMHLAIMHFCNFLNNEYTLQQDRDFALRCLDVFKTNRGYLLLLLRELIKSNPTKTEISEMICSLIASNLLILRKSNEVPTDVMNEMFDMFIYMNLHSSSVDKTAFKKSVSNVIHISAKNNYFSQEKLYKWHIFLNINTDTYFGPNVNQNTYINGHLELFSDIKKFERPEYLSYNVSIVKAIQPILIKKGYVNLQKCYKNIFKQFKKMKERLLNYPRTQESLIEALATLKTLAKEAKKITVYNAIEKEWQAVCKDAGLK